MHQIEIGDIVRSEFSGRTGEVVDCTNALVLVAFNDQHTNTYYSEAPTAWIPHLAVKVVTPVVFQ